MNNWYDKVTVNTIKTMKSNERSHRMLKFGYSGIADLFEQVPLEDLVYLKRECGFDEIKWDNAADIVSHVMDINTYRLRPDWEPRSRPEPEFIPCPICGNPDVVSDCYDYQLDMGVHRFYQRICDECDLAMESSDSQADADRKWNNMAKKLGKNENKKEKNNGQKH